MRGHEKIIAMRMARKSPEWVFLNDYPCETDWFENADFATVCTDGDSISMLDLRFLVGLKVSIGAGSEVRAKALFAAAKLAGASVVGACEIQSGVPGFKQSGWSSVWRKPVIEKQLEDACG